MIRVESVIFFIFTLISLLIIYSIALWIIRGV